MNYAVKNFGVFFEIGEHQSIQQNYLYLNLPLWFQILYCVFNHLTLLYHMIQITLKFFMILFLYETQESFIKVDDYVIDPSLIVNLILLSIQLLFVTLIGFLVLLFFEQTVSINCPIVRWLIFNDLINWVFKIHQGFVNPL